MPKHIPSRARKNPPPKGKVPPQLEGKGFKKGQSGNPNGRPPNKTLEQMFQDFLQDEVAPKEGLPKDQRMRFFFLHLFSRAMSGSAQHARLLMEYSMSKPKQEIDLNHQGNVVYQIVCGVDDPTTKLPDDPALNAKPVIEAETVTVTLPNDKPTNGK